MVYARWIRIASLFGLGTCLLMAAADLFFVRTVPGWPSLDLAAGTTSYFTFAATPAGRIVGMLALLLDTLANATFWLALWQLGRRLGAPLSDSRVAVAFRRLALAFGAYVLLRGLAMATLLVAYLAFGGRTHFGLNVGDTGLLLGGLGGLIAWCVARLLRQAAEVATENAGFV